MYISFYIVEMGDYGRAIRLLLITGLSYCVSYLPWPYLCTQQVSFINVGQGDAILLRDHDKVVLLDTGGIKSFDIAKETLIPYLHKNRIYHIDALIASHHDYDHIGGKDSLMSSFNVKAFYDDASQFPLDVGCMHFENLNIYDYEEENDRSLVFLLSFMGKRWLLTGDAPEKVESRIIEDHPDLDCGILKAGHHGSSTSSSASFLDAVTPEVAIISCGWGNKYGHPNQDVLERLNERHISIRRTDLEGTITYWGFG